MSTEPKRRRIAPDLLQAAGLLLVTAGVWTASTAAGLVVAGAGCLWVGWSQS